MTSQEAYFRAIVTMQAVSLLCLTLFGIRVVAIAAVCLLALDTAIYVIYQHMKRGKSRDETH